MIVSLVDDEDWKDVWGFPGYQVSNYGRCASFWKGDKIPKPLLVNEWRPRAVVLSGSKMSNGKLRTYLNDCDLIIHYDTDISPFHRDVEKI